MWKKTLITNDGGNDGDSEVSTQHKDHPFIHDILTVVITHKHISPYCRIRFWMVKIEKHFLSLIDENIGQIRTD